MDFVCRSLETAIEAISSWYHIDATHLYGMLSQNFYQTYVNSTSSHDGLFSNYLYQQLPFKTDNTEPLPRVHWFHGTRCTNPNDYYDKGLLPLSSIWSTLQKKVDAIACEHKIPRTKRTTKIGNFSASLIDAKMNGTSINDGPCAWLNYEAMELPHAFNTRDYTAMPEIVEDYVNSGYGKRADEVKELYKNASKRAIVEFWSIPDDSINLQMERIVKAFLTYIYAKIHIEDDCLGEECNTYYIGFGTPVLPERIVSVKLL